MNCPASTDRTKYRLSLGQSMDSIDLKQKLSLFDDHWAPRTIAQMNNHEFKLVKLQGEFVWHSHEDIDEAFIVLEGSMCIDLEDDVIELEAGQMVVIPRGVRHRPRAEDESKVMLVEPKGVVNTGDAGGEMTADQDVWI